MSARVPASSSSSGGVWQKIPVDFELTDVCYAGHDTRGNSSDDRYIMLTGEKKTRLMKAGGNRSERMVFQLEGGVAKPEETGAFASPCRFSLDGSSRHTHLSRTP